jgi:hypothetical protein
MDLSSRLRAISSTPLVGKVFRLVLPGFWYFFS